MTPEQELELLIREQEADDTYFIDRPADHVSLDVVRDLIMVDPETGELIVDFPLPPTPPLANAHQHGTNYGYMHLKCRCRPCKDANSSYMREYRRSRAKS